MRSKSKWVLVNKFLCNISSKVARKKRVPDARVAKRWRALSGLANWDGLLSPLDSDLRRYIIHYGEMAQATYDAFDEEKSSRYAGSCRYAKRDFFARVDLLLGNPYRYQGGVEQGIELDRRKRSGAQGSEEAGGFVQERRNKHHHHRPRLGAAIATLNSVDIVANAINRPKGPKLRPIPVTAFLFASPKVGDPTFCHVFSEYRDLRALRVHNVPDIVPVYPAFAGYAEVGEELVIDTLRSGYLKVPGNVLSWHNLECYLHGVAGTQGPKEGFELVVKRDIALVNKKMDGLKDEYLVPPSWRCEKNKGMVQLGDGSWKLVDHENED
ncbi:hypothetical protein MLD38_010077 [Melastoma candidum]|uniref:Uncharacterized protein n=1 Tax=Melastoma candidum TaxID=119954 RepID=A0ACB9R285_9MYRT|nr:hypothetical protein MLD38_010077 [Melastoma candidum]